MILDSIVDLVDVEAVSGVGVAARLVLGHGELDGLVVGFF